MTEEVKQIRELMRKLPPERKKELIDSLPPSTAEVLLYDWFLWARDKQIRPEGRDWSIWILNCGRGFGKTRVGAETVRMWAEENPGTRIVIVGRTSGEAKSICVEGESGILAVSPSWFYPTWKSSKGELIWPNGSVARVYTAEKPDKFRGEQCQFLWLDEFAAYRYLTESWNALIPAWRLGDFTQAIITTTPRPVKLLKELMKRPDVIVTKGSTYENLENLAPDFRRNVVEQLEGTRFGRQELHAEILDDIPGALWTLKRLAA